MLLSRSEIASETDRLMVLCGQWEPKVEDESIPEESERIPFPPFELQTVVVFLTV